jgi:hypothetical protein
LGPGWQFLLDQTCIVHQECAGIVQYVLQTGTVVGVLQYPWVAEGALDAVLLSVSSDSALTLKNSYGSLASAYSYVKLTKATVAVNGFLATMT